MKTGLLIRRTAVLLPFAIVGEVWAADAITAKVVYTGTYGDGSMYVGLDTTINEVGCQQPRFDVPSTHPSIKNFIATAITAAATGLPVRVRAVGCLNGLPTMDQTADSWFYFFAQ
jgi:hypothetical protein